MSYFAIILVIVFFVLIFPFPLKAQGFLDVQSKKFFYTIKLFGISLYSGFLSIHHGKLQETNFFGKTHLLQLRDINFNMQGFPDIGISIFKYATFDKVNMFCEVGSSDNIANCVMGTGFMYTLLGLIISKIKNYDNKTNVSSYVVTKTDKDTFELSIDSKIKVSLISIIISIIKDIHKVGKKNNV